MTRRELSDLKQWFRRLVRRYRTEDLDLCRNVDLKVKHTINVCREIRLIGADLNLSEGEQLLAESVALLHDVGRFEQYARHRTFADSQSEDHAQLGLRLLSQEGVLGGFGPDDAELVVCAISYHNRAVVPRDASDRCVFFSNLLRDADKLDIWRVVIEYYHQSPEERNEAVAIGYVESPGISSPVAHRLRKRQSVDRVDVRNINDFKLLQIGWVYDLNFRPTYRAVRDRRYVQSIAETLPVTPEVTELVTIALKELDRMCGGEGTPRTRRDSDPAI